jgi:DNA-binding NtrC family response regulator
MNNCKILITDDDDIFRKSVNMTLSSNKECEFQVFEAKVGEEALDIISKNPDIGCIILDYNFEKYGGPGQMNGLEIAGKVKQITPHIPIIMTSEVGDRGDIAMKAAKEYIHGFLDKPFREEQLINKITPFFLKSFELNSDLQKTQQLFNKYGFISVSQKMQQVCYEALIAAKNDWNVLILGETGTGKTLLANIIHRLSNRADKPFISANCCAITPTLIESELFGLSKGCFTGAADNKKGLFEIADDGTLFLDEIAKIPYEIQAKLNYAIDDNREFYRVGRPDIKLTNKARIIAATLHDTRNATDKISLRNDIKARFTSTIKIPPLRERPEDIIVLVREFIKRYKEVLSIDSAISVNSDALNLLSRQPWNKNCHQLSNIIKRIIAKCIFKKSKKITLQDVKDEFAIDYGIEDSNLIEIDEYNDLAKLLSIKLLDNIDSVVAKNIRKKGAGGLKALLDILEKQILKQALERNEGNVLSTSKYLHENKDTLRNHLRRLGIE